MLFKNPSLTKVIGGRGIGSNKKSASPNVDWHFFYYKIYYLISAVEFDLSILYLLINVLMLALMV